MKPQKLHGTVFEAELNILLVCIYPEDGIQFVLVVFRRSSAPIGILLMPPTVCYGNSVRNTWRFYV